MRISVDVERQSTALRLVPEGPFDGVDQAGEEDFFCLHRYGTGLDLRQIENVGDQV